MSVKNKYFNKKKGSLKNFSHQTLSESIESPEYATEINKTHRLVDLKIDYDDPSEFAFWGSARAYYEDSFYYIYQSYPYDGSKYEQQKWYNEATPLDRFIFDNVYPKTTGSIKMGDTWGTTLNTLGEYQLSDSPEYIHAFGGPNNGFEFEGLRRTSNRRGLYDNSNKYDPSKSRESNLKCDFDKGITVEWFQKKEAYQTGTREVIWEIWNGEEIASPSYGRIAVEMKDGVSPAFRITCLSGTSGFTDIGIGNLIDTDAIDGKWRHFALSFKNNPETNKVKVRFFINSVKVSEQDLGTSKLNEIVGALQLSLGSMASPPPGGLISNGKGFGKSLKVHFDEFRFWKEERTDEQIRLLWNTNVGGGTNRDDNTTMLGLYYKFNEGIVGKTSIDSVVLDYSGRTSNGNWIGYNAGTGRSSSSAIVSGGFNSKENPDPIIYSSHPSVVSIIEEYREKGAMHDEENFSSLHASMPNYLQDMHETENVDEHGRKFSDFFNFIQAMASIFDESYIQTKLFPEARSSDYTSPGNPLFEKMILRDKGYNFEDIFTELSSLEHYEDRTNEKNFEGSLTSLRSKIYKNIINNISIINKSKGTRKSFRNLLHCFGINEEHVAIVLTGKNTKVPLTQGYDYSETKTNVISFNSPDRFNSTIYQHGGDAESFGLLKTHPNSAYIPLTMHAKVILPEKRRLDDSLYFSTPFLNSSIGGFHAATSEGSLSWLGTEISSLRLYVEKQAVDSKHIRFSLQGILGITPINLKSTDTNFNPAKNFFSDCYENDTWDLFVQLYHSKYPYYEGPSGSNLGDFVLKFSGRRYIQDALIDSFDIETTIPKVDGEVALLSGKRFYVGAHRENFIGGVVTPSDVEISNFNVWVEKLEEEEIDNISKYNDSFGLMHPTRGLYSHNEIISTFRTFVPRTKSHVLSWNFEKDILVDGSGEGKILDEVFSDANQRDVLGWFGDTYSYFHNGKAVFFPINSTITERKSIPSLKKKLLGELGENDFIKVVASDLESLNFLEDDEVYQRSTRPSELLLTFEKSPYRAVSNQILKSFSAFTDFNDLLGNPVHRYRGEYKNLNYLKRLFFEGVSEDVDIEKYFSFFKWVDESILQLLSHLVPASLDFSENTWNVIENHILSREKYQWKFPLLEKKPSTESSAQGIEKLTYNWRRGSYPASGLASENKLWWKERAERDITPITSGDVEIDNSRNAIKEIKETYSARINPEKVTALNPQGLPTLLESSTSVTPDETYLASTYVLRRFNKIYKISGELKNSIKGGPNFHPNKNISFYKNITKYDGDRYPFGAPREILLAFRNDLIEAPKIEDSLKERNVSVTVQSEISDEARTNSLTHDSRFSFPFNVKESPVTTGYNSQVVQKFGSGFEITNLHHDMYDTKEVPMQTTFTRATVGGSLYRHVRLNTIRNHPESEFPTTPMLDEWDTRPEGFKLLLGSLTDSCSPPLPPPNPAGGVIGLVGADYPYPPEVYTGSGEVAYPWLQQPIAIWYRDGMVKRPINIQNIKHSEGYLWNYRKTYEVFLLGSRRNNNWDFKEKSGYVVEFKNSSLISGSSTQVQEWASPTRIDQTKRDFVITPRFASPGGFETHLGSDVETSEFCIYSSLPYRNLSVRLPMNELLARVAGKFGEDFQLSDASVPPPVNLRETRSEYYYSGDWYTILPEGKPAFSKVQKNAKLFNAFNGVNYEFIEKYDNFFVQRALGSSHLNQKWFKMSLHPVDELDPDGYDLKKNADGKKDGYRWSLASDSVILNNPRFHYLWFNDTFIENIVDDSTLSSSPDAESGFSFYHKKVHGLSNLNVNDEFRGVLLKRGSLYGFPIWKQLRGSEHPVIKHQRRKNKIPYMITGSDFYTVTTEDSPVSSYTYPIVQKITKDGKSYTFSYPYYANYVNFSKVENNQKLQKNTFGTKNETFVKIFKSANRGEIVSDFVSYSQRIYPRPENEGLYNVRTKRDWEEIPGFASIHDYGKKLLTRRTYWKDDKGREDGDYVTSFSLTSSLLSSIVSPGDNWFYGNSFFPLGNDYLPSGSISDGVYVDFQNVIGVLHPEKQKHGELSPKPVFGNGTRHFYNNAPTRGWLKDANPWPQHIRQGDAIGMQPASLYNGPSGIRVFDANIVYTPDLGHASELVYPFNFSKNDAPFYNSYEEFSEDIFPHTKQHSVLPEYNTTRTYEVCLGLGFSECKSYNEQTIEAIDIDGISNLTQKSLQEVYGSTHYINGIDSLRVDLKEQRHNEKKFKLEFEVNQKFRPDNGFYPVVRSMHLLTVLFNALKSGIKNPVTGLGNDLEAIQAILGIFANPGLFFNALRSGIAVDYPIVTELENSEMTVQNFVNWSDSSPAFSHLVLGLNNDSNKIFSHRLPFEALLEPDKWLPKNKPIYANIHDTSLAENASPNVPGYVLPSGLWNGELDDSYSYKEMSKNFFSEIKDFYMGEKEVFESEEESNFKELKAGLFYMMDIVLYKSTDFKNHQSMLRDMPPAKGGPRNFDGQYYGPPIFKGDTESDATKELRAIHYSDPAYAPFTPPYFYGTSIARICFIPTETRKYSLNEILKDASIHYIQSVDNVYIDKTNNETYGGPGASSAAYKEAMSINASINLFDRVDIDRKEIINEVSGQTILSEKIENPKQKWIISPKFECPLLNFKKSDPWLPTNHIHGTGLWSERGAELNNEDDTGLFWGILDHESTSLAGFRTTINSVTYIHEAPSYQFGPAFDTGMTRLERNQIHSLADALGFKKGIKKIGVPQEKYKLKEGIMMIPYVENPKGIDIPLVQFRDKYLFAIDERVLNLQKDNVRKTGYAVEVGDYNAKERIQKTSITNALDFEEEFVIPWEFNFVKNREKPFVFYGVKSEKEINRHDLYDMWQNILPDSLKKNEKKTLKVEHTFDTWEFLHGNVYPKNTKWLIFKVKNKSKSFNEDMKYNWPHDHYSLIETGKVQATSFFVNEKKDKE